MAKKKMLDNSKYTEQIRKTTWGVDMREPIAKALENQIAVHDQRVVSYQMDAMGYHPTGMQARIEKSTPQKDYRDHYDRVPGQPNKDCQNAALISGQFFTLNFNRADQP